MTSRITQPLLSPNQHAVALHGYDCCVFPPPQLEWNWDWDWDYLQQLHTPGAGEDDAALLQEATSFQLQATLAAGVESPASSEASSGCLQDAVDHWNVDGCNKRQRTTPPPWRRTAAGLMSDDLQCLLESFWDPIAAEGEGGGGDLSHDLKTTTSIVPEMSSSFVSEEDRAGASGRDERDPSTQTSAEQGGEEAAAAAVPPPPHSAVRVAAPLQLQLQKATAGAPHASARPDDLARPVVELEPSSSREAATTATLGASCPSATPAAGKAKPGAGVLYPFAVVKPLGLDDGCMTTLSDVNQRILKRPARPVRHPVGEFACGPAVTAHGLGLSGKAVVSLAKIRTGGKGTITIIRTRG